MKEDEYEMYLKGLGVYEAVHRNFEHVRKSMKPSNGFSVSRQGMTLRGATRDQAVDWAASGGGNATVFDSRGNPVVQIIQVVPE